MSINNKDLYNAFLNFNERFFGERLGQDLKIRFSKLHRMEGVCYRENGPSGLICIDVNEDLKKHPDFALQVLLHEMVHADLDQQGYVGCPTDEGHGMRFQAEICRLFMQGAFDGFL